MPSREKGPAQGSSVDPAALLALMSRAGIAVAALDDSERVSMASPSLKHLLNRSFADMTATSLAEQFHLYDEDGTRLLEPHEVPIVRAARGEIVEDEIVTVRTPGQPVRYLRVNAIPIVGVDGSRQGAWAITSDVTRVVAAARGELSRSLAETVNHTLRTPLTTLLGHAELLLDDRDALPQRTQRSLEAMSKAGRRLNDVVTWISEWIDLALPPDQEPRRIDLAEYLDRIQRT